MDELEICLAALFLNKGRDVLTAKEFTMYVSLDLRWMQVKDADALMTVLIEKKLMARTGEYLRPAVDISSIIVPVAYRPSESFIDSLRVRGQPAAAKKADGRADVLSKLIGEALAAGMGKGAFVSECNKLSKRADVDMEVAALMLLREKGVDVSPFIDEVLSSILGR